MTANAKMRLTGSVLAFADDEAASNPRRRFVDWNQDISDLDVTNPSSQPKTLAAGVSMLIFDGTRGTSIDNTTEFDLTLVLGTVDRYRFRWVAGTNPVFRTDRSLNLTGATVTITQNGNGTALFAASGGPDFTGVVEGDVVYIPGIDEGITSPFHEANQGIWTVVVATPGALTMVRQGDFEVTGEVVAVTAANQLQAFSAAGVQVGDNLDVTLGFSSYNQRAFVVLAVTSKYLEVEASLALAPEAGVAPTAAGFTLYTSAKRYLRIETDQEIVVKVNGDTGTLQRVTPWTAGDKKKVGEYVRAGVVYALTVVNRSSKPANVLIISAE